MGAAGGRASANEQTFVYTNAAPQAAAVQPVQLLWAGLEDYVLDHARTYRQRLCVFTGPVLAADDPPYRGVQIPRRFYKIAAWATGAADGPERARRHGLPAGPDARAARPPGRDRAGAARRRAAAARARTGPTRCPSPTSPR